MQTTLIEWGIVSSRVAVIKQGYCFIQNRTEEEIVQVRAGIKQVVVVKITILKAKAKLRLWIAEYIYAMNYETNGPQDHGSCGHLLHHSLIASLSS